MSLKRKKSQCPPFNIYLLLKTQQVQKTTFVCLSSYTHTPYQDYTDDDDDADDNGDLDHTDSDDDDDDSELTSAS